MDTKRRKHDDTKVSLHPLTFDEAITELAKPSKQDRKTKTSENAKEAVPESESSD